MDLSQLKHLPLCIAALVSVGCGTASKTTEQTNQPSRQVVSMLGDARHGEHVPLPANSGLGMDSVVVDQTYIAASGRLCRRLRTVDGELIQRVACKSGDGVWSLARDLQPNSTSTPVTSGADIVSQKNDYGQPLVPSAGSLLLLNEQNSVPADATSPEQAGALMSSAAESLMQASDTVLADHSVRSGAQVSQIDLTKYASQSDAQVSAVTAVEYIPGSTGQATEIDLTQYSSQADGQTPDIVVAEFLPRSDRQPTEIDLTEYSSHARTTTSGVIPVESPTLAAAQPVYTDAQVQAPSQVVYATTSMQARAESLIISKEEHARQTGAALLDDTFAPTVSQAGPLTVLSDTAELETVQRTLNANETLWSFARRTTGSALNWETIANINGITDAKTLSSGTSLLIPVELVGYGD